MKKAVITLLALAGVAAADWAAEDANGWIYKYGSSWITHSATVTENETTKDLTIAFLNANGGTIDFSHNDNNRCRYTFALTLNLGTLQFPSSATSAAWGGGKIGFGLKESAVTACIGGGNASWNTTGLTLGSKGTLTLIVTTDEKGSMILAYGGADTYTSTPTAQTGEDTNKVNGTTTAGGTYYGWTNLKEGEDITSFTIDSSIAGSVEKFAVWDSDVATQGLNSTQMLQNMDSVASAMKSIPEPTTATLSLLALAGLAARRRRQ